MTTHDVLDRVRAVNPVRLLPSATPEDELLLTRITATPRPPRRARRSRPRRAVLAALVGVPVALGGAAAAADWVPSHTGSYSHGGESGHGEMLAVGGSDFLTVARRYGEGVDYPAGYSTEPWLQSMKEHESDSMISEGVLREEFLLAGVCAWSDAWTTADRRGDSAARASATEHLAGVAASPLLAETTDELADGHGTRVRRHWELPPLVTAARDGDARTVSRYVAGCASTYLPR